ncbi:MAG: TonB-dependent receptor, partial [Bacteroidales bacterium]|nr:TonB-dependent receptor [Bacteroidales bacterium]
GETVAGANVVEKGTTNGIITDMDGHFTLSVQENAVLRISYVGYVTQEVSTAGRTTLDITLAEDAQALDEVVVIGYGTQKKANLSGAVSAISGKALENRPVTNANLALQGLAPGMNIVVGSGQASEAPGINIRGITSINGGEAFILVDNVPVTKEELARINPADIESATLLEDAASAAIYGARAAYGVVLITTKTAKSEKLQVQFDASYGIRQRQMLAELLTDPYFYMTEINAAVFPNVRYTDAQVAYAKQRSEDPSLPETILHPNNPSQWDYYAANDWVDIMLRNTSPTYNANLSIAQKTDKLSYTLSGSYYQQDGILNMENDVLRRYNFRGKGTYRFTNWWEVGSNISFVTSGYDAPTVLDGWYNKMLACRTTYPLYNPDGTYTSTGADVYALLTEGGRKNTQVNETQVSFNTTVDLLKDVWNIKGDINFRRANTSIDKDAFSTSFHNGPDLDFQTRMTDSRVYNELEAKISNYTVMNVYTDFHKTFGDKHYVQALAGFNQEYLYNNDYWTRRNDLITTSLPTLQLATGEISNGQGITELALRGLFFRANYIYDNKYILEFNGRRDGTSRYPKKSRFGFFPSGSAAWVVSKERFFEGAGKALRISNLKLRGSYGELGNQVNNSYYPYLATMGSGNIGSRLDGSYPMGISQPGVVAGDLTWERVRSVNVGIDLGLLDNRFDLTANIYTRYTEGMLTASETLPSFYGAGAPTTNAADLKTKGWDVSVGYRDRVNAGGSPLSYSARFMLWDSRAWITKFSNPNGIITHLDQWGYTQKDYREGMELGEIWGYHTAGYFSSNEEAQAWADQSATGTHVFEAGDLKFYDLNDDGKINAGSNTVDDPGDRTIIGNDTERFRYSFEGNVEWKGFDLRIFLYGVGKRDYAIANHRNFWGTYDSQWINPTTAQLDRWTPEDPNGYLPKLRGDNDELRLPQTKYLQDASWMRIKNLTVGYTLPDALLAKWKINRLRIYLSGENLWTLNNLRVKWVDPEVIKDEYYPMQRVWSMGVSLNF